MVQVKDQSKKEGEVLAFFHEDNIEPFDVDYQNRFLNVFISDREGFPERIIDIVQVEFFESYQRILLDYEINFFNQYREIARFSTLRDIVSEKEKGLNKEHLLGLIDKIEGAEIQNTKHVKDSSYRFFKERSVKNCLFELVSEWKKHNYDSMKMKLENALKAGEPKEVGHDYLEDIEKRLKGDFRKPISAFPSIDKFIGGGLSPGEMGIVLAPTGGGKSMMLVRFASNALIIGKKVLYYTLELSEEAVGNRFDACINQVNIKEVWDFPDIIKEKAVEIGENGGRLIVKEFDSGFASLNTIEAHIRNLHSSIGFIPDIIFIDYGDLLRPLDSFSEKRHSLDSIYVGIRGLATRLKVPIWNAAQTNRSGMDQEQVSLSTIGESLGNARAADIVIGVGRTPEDKEKHTATIGILKNRNGGDGFYKPAIFDTKKINIEILDIDPETIVGKKPNNAKSSKKNDKSVDDYEDDMNSVFSGY